MAAADTAAGLAGFAGRGAGTDAERRAAGWLAEQVRSSRRAVRVETFWCRPNWAMTHVWHCLVALAGALLMVSHPTAGGALVLGVLLSLLLDAFAGLSPARRLTPERASQNVVSPAPAERPVRLIVTANYDAGRTGLAYRDLLRVPGARLKRLLGDGRLTPGWLGWLVIELAWLVAVAVLRRGGAHGTLIGAIQLVPTALLVLELALLLELAGGAFGPAAGDNAAGSAVAIALVRALDAAPPRHLAVELVLQGAGDGQMIGLRRHLRARRRELRPADTIVLGVGACGAGRPCWWISDGPLIPMRYLARLRGLAAQVAEAEPGGLPHGVTQRAAGRRGRGTAPPLPARVRGLPALAIGSIDQRGLAPRSHQRTDRPETLDRAAMDRLVAFSLMLVDAIDADLGRTRSASTGRQPAQTHA